MTKLPNLKHLKTVLSLNILTYQILDGECKLFKGQILVIRNKYS